MIRLLGDIHGEAEYIYVAAHNAAVAGDAAVFQVGDIGLFLKLNGQYFQNALDLSPKIDIYFLEGNHDDCIIWTQYQKITEIMRGRNGARLLYVPRGTVFELDGRTIAVMGGAASIDKLYRLRTGRHWDLRENITFEEEDRFLANVKERKIDIFLSHTPPSSVVNGRFNPMDKLQFGVGPEWNDPNMDVVQRCWEATGFAHNYSGHMHRSVKGPSYTVLDINEELQV